jgi:lipopolysaccharide export system protein LptA
MTNNLQRLIYVLCCLVFNPFNIVCQSDQDTTKEVIIQNADYQEILLKHVPPIQKLIGNVRAFHEGSFFYCDSAILSGKNLSAYGDVIIIQNDTTEIFGDSLIYKGIERSASIYGQVIFINGRDSLFTEELKYDLANEIALFNSTLQLMNQGTTVKSEKAIYSVAENMAEFYNHVSVEGDDFLLSNDTLFYNTDSRISEWKVPTQIFQDSSEIYSESGFYDLSLKEGEFYSNVEYKNGNSTSKADTITLKEEGNLITLISNASYTSDTDTAIAEIIKVNRSTDIIKLIENASYRSKNNQAEGDTITYDKGNDQIKLSGPSSISDAPILIYGNDIQYNKKNKEGVIRGNVIWRDTSADIEILCDSLDYKGEEGFAIAIGFDKRPLLLIYTDEDTTFISGDTLRKIRAINQLDSLGTMDTIDYMIGDNDIRIFNSDYQAISDTLSYNLSDSIITLTQEPVLWTDTSQMSGDTIKMFIVEDKLSSMHIQNNAYIINSPDLVFFNQIKGRIVDIDFLNRKINKMKVEGNAESLYYMLDDKDAYIGVNALKCSFIIFDFTDGQLHRIGSFNNPESVLYPMEGTNHENLKIQGFNWRYNLSPKSPMNLRKFNK